MNSLVRFTTFEFIILYLLANALFSYLMFKASGFRNFWAFVLLFLFNSVMVIVGPVLTMLLYFYLLNSDKNSANIRIRTIDKDQLIFSYPNVTRDYRKGPLDSFMSAEDDPFGRKLNLLSYLAENFHRDDMSVFYATLSGKGDESRLFCFGTISKMEKRLNDRISVLTDKIEKCEDILQKAKYEKELSYHYWDFVYYRLVNEDLEEFYLKSAKKHIQNALEYGLTDHRIYILLARIYLKMKRYEEALKVFEKIKNYSGFKKEVSPYLAELYFQMRDFKKMKKILKELKSLGYTPEILSVTSLYGGGGCLTEKRA